MDISIIISTVTSIFATSVGIFGIYYGWKQNEKQLQTQRELQQKEFEKRDETDRREYLALVIRDESWGIGPRRLAATEYLKKGYNGFTKQYIMDNKLIDESFFTDYSGTGNKT